MTFEVSRNYVAALCAVPTYLRNSEYCSCLWRMRATTQNCRAEALMAGRASEIFGAATGAVTLLFPATPLP